jgi:hypothetical protein
MYVSKTASWMKEIGSGVKERGIDIPSFMIHSSGIFFKGDLIIPHRHSVLGITLKILPA